MRPHHRWRRAEHGDGAGFVTIALFAVGRLNAGKGRGAVANRFDFSMQRWLVVFQLNDQMRPRRRRGFEGFFGNASHHT